VQSQESLLNINTDLEKRVSARIAELSESEQQKQQIINMLPASVVVIRGQDLIVELINQSNLDYWNKTAEEVIGRPFLEILPDLADQPFAGQLRKVMATGEIIDVKESPVLFENEDGTTRETFVDYTYQPLMDINGNRTGVLVMSFEITERVAARKLLEKYAEELQESNAKLSVANSGLASSGARFKYLIQEAPVAIGVLSGRELVIDSANDLILRIWGKSKNVIGMSLTSALPELQGQPFWVSLMMYILREIPTMEMNCERCLANWMICRNII
jgi:PAS domain S-box-containing protein